MKKVGKIVLTFILSLIGILFVGLLIILIYSPGKLEPLKDTQGNVIQGSISEKVWLEVGGIKQGMFIRGENPLNPIILYAHGGPGVPMLHFISYLEKIGEMDTIERLEKYFTVCYWEQRGSGMTYSKSKDPSTMTLEQMVEDTHEVTEYLKSRFGQDKIYLMGQSWGSYLSVSIIQKHPENYFAYIGVGQSVNFVESERLSYKYMLNHAKEINDKDAIENLEKFDPYAKGFPMLQEKGHELDYLKVRTKLVGKYGIGHVHQFPKGMTYNKGIFVTLFHFKGYTLREKVSWILGTDFSMIQLFPPMVDIDLSVLSTKFEIPFYIVQGAYDYQTSQVLAEKYLNIIEAPKKEFFIFENSAHSPNLEESEKFVKIFHKIASGNLLEK
jgi:pimeloyl-ACP methyl ester carboxylesterase